MSENFRELLGEKYEKYFNEKAEEPFLEACETHYELLCEYNEKFNLTRITSVQDSVLLHYIDSFFIPSPCKSRVFKDGVSMCDIGSGGGFPALPLLFLMIFQKKVKNAKMTLIESSNKKADFLDTVIKTAVLSKSVRTAVLRIEEAGASSKFREKFDIITARALAALPVLFEYASPLIRPGGVCLLMKGEDIEAEKKSAQKALKEFNLKLAGDFVYEIETMQYKRRIMMVEKTGPLSKKYPRQPGMAKKAPIV